MNFSEFKRWLGAEPRSRDTEFLGARHSAPEFEQAAADAERFETKLERALLIPAPEVLAGEIAAIARSADDAPARKSWWPMALAASFLVAVGAAGLTWNASRSWDSVEEYVLEHYRHDGAQMLASMDSASASDVQAVLSQLDVQATDGLSAIVGVIKYCPTPDGKGVHMVLNTEKGPVTVIYMPETRVTDRETFGFDNMEAILVDLERGSAAIIGSESQGVSSLYATVHEAIVPAPGSS